MTPDYSPRGIGKVLDDAIAIYRSQFRTLATAAAYILLPLSLTASLAQTWYFRAAFSQMAVPSSVSSTGPDSLVLLQMVVSYAIMAAALVSFGVASLYFASSIWNSAAALITREKLTTRQFLAAGKKRFGWLVLMYFAIFLASQVVATVGAIGLFLFVLPGVAILVAMTVAAVYISLAEPIVVLEAADVVEAVRRSIALVRGNAWRVVGFWLGTAVVTYALQAAIGSFGALGSAFSVAQAGGVNVPLGWQVLAGVTQGVGQALTQPLAYMAMLVFYLDLRARNEGIDLLARAQALSVPEAMSRAILRATSLVAAACVLALVLAASASALGRGERASTFDDYRSRVTRARAEVHDRRQAAITTERGAVDLAGELNGLLPGTERVDVGGTIVEVDNSMIRSMVARLDAAVTNPERKATVEMIEQHLASLQRAVEDGRTSVPSDPAALRDLLSQQQLSSRPTLSDIIAKWVDRLTAWLQERFANAASRPGSATAVDIFLVLVVAILVALLGAVIWLVWRGLSRALVAHDRRFIAEQEYAPVIAAAEGLPTDALAYAEELAAAGRFRDALRALFGGAARSLVDRGLLRSTRTRTDAELLADLRPVAPGVVPPLGDLADRFEYAWYGHVDPGEGGFANARAAYGATLAAVESHKAAKGAEAS